MNVDRLEFRSSAPLTMGVELELQLVDRRTGDLTRAASDLIALVTRRPFPGDIKPEITESMLEVSTSVHNAHAPLLAELVAMRETLVAGADLLDIEVCGGGAHPFQRWYDRQIYDRPRFRHVAGLYGYLAKQFTVFGQHVHIGCDNGTQAMRLLHRLAGYIPQFIALAASSPYFQGVDTSFDCSRLNSIYAFPLSGRAPFLTDWPAFERYFARLRGLGVVESMKDFYWDIRPKPEYGTIEVRVFDTPLAVERAAALAAFVQAVCAMLLDRTEELNEEAYLSYNYNRFQACRFGLEGQVLDSLTGESTPLHIAVLKTLEACRPYARDLQSLPALDAIERWVRTEGNDARWQRETLQSRRSLADLVLESAARWRGPALAAADAMADAVP
ncbi:MAG TPA: YbdK family carboxylate-amine ligase [Burkholderiaceae bacterium]|nr:YbdK family carboxylate-amine ligase [Burkholderiaceae bacterium]HQR71176.1 YbdK family carboxylate-amine ligase [Burkholderiaceae bacterium]